MPTNLYNSQILKTVKDYAEEHKNTACSEAHQDMGRQGVLIGLLSLSGTVHGFLPSLLSPSSPCTHHSANRWTSITKSKTRYDDATQRSMTADLSGGCGVRQGVYVCCATCSIAKKIKIVAIVDMHGIVLYTDNCFCSVEALLILAVESCRRRVSCTCRVASTPTTGGTVSRLSETEPTAGWVRYDCHARESD